MRAKLRETASLKFHGFWDNLSFYLVQVAAFRIGDSAPAPLFTVIAAPSEESKAIGRQKKDLAERHITCMEFWRTLLDRAKMQGVNTHANVSPSKDSWLDTGAGKSGLAFRYSITQDRGGAELYIDTGDKERNESIYDQLHAHKDDVEGTFGGELEWERLDNRRACRVRHCTYSGGLKNEESWNAMQGEMVDTMNRLVKALKPYIQALR